ncbi:hypothetical protein Tco_1182970 [Tanacetum coccineum]
MSDLKFVETHNLVVFLEKPDEYEGFEQIVDFMNVHTIKYALTINPTIYTSCIQQFWAAGKAKTVNGEGSANLTDTHKTPIITQPSTSQPQKKQPRRKQSKDTEVPQPSGCTEPIADEPKNMECVPTHSNDLLLSGGCIQRGEEIADIDADAEEVEVEKVVSTVKVTTNSATTTIVDELTLAQTLIEIKPAKPNVRGVMIQEPSELTTTTTTTTPAASKPS